MKEQPRKTGGEGGRLAGKKELLSRTAAGKGIEKAHAAPEERMQKVRRRPGHRNETEA